MTTPTSRRPSSARASGNTSTPPNSSPTLPTRMHEARPSNHVVAVDADLRLEHLGGEVLRAAPQVRDAADLVLEVVGVADHRGVEADAGHDGEALAGEAADVEAPARAAQPDRDRLLDVLRDAEVRGEEVRGARREHGEAGVLARHLADAAAHGAVPAPGEDAAPRPRRARGAPAWAPSWPWAPRTRADRRSPPPRARAAAPGSPSPSVFSACATTATFTTPPACRTRARRGSGPAPGRAASADAAREEQDGDRAEPDQQAAHDVERVVHALVHAREGDEQRQDHGRGPERDPAAAGP